jgi:hypothetical protein
MVWYEEFVRGSPLFLPLGSAPTTKALLGDQDGSFHRLRQ